ncbi:MAG: cytochrome-c oxidase, cbb3-type subunit II, partial [Sedimenticola sp.]|nr:cytochrome-c oxidase, cbb3-type subunit II [Sedimenticola sp.]
MAMQEKLEKNIWAMIIVTALVLSVGGIVEIVPLFYLDSTMEHKQHPEILWQRTEGQALADHKAGEGMRPYSAL